MEEIQFQQKEKTRVFGAYIATQISIYFIVLLTIIGELYKPFKIFQVSLTGHHWTTKSAVTLILFLIIMYVWPKRDFILNKIIKITIINTVIGIGLILLFFILHNFNVL